MDTCRLPWEALFRALEAMSSKRCRIDLCSTVLTELKSLAPYEMGYFFLFDTRGRLSCCETEGVDERRKRQYFDYYMQIDPCRRASSPSARCIHTDWSRFYDTEFYVDFGRPQGVRYSAGMQLHLDTGALLGVVFLTRSGELDFSPTELALLEALCPQVENLVSLVMAAEDGLLLGWGAGTGRDIAGAIRHPLGPPRVRTPPSGSGLLARGTEMTGSADPVSAPHARESAHPLNREPLDHLSCRERQIAGLLCRGYSTKAVASSLLISPATVYRHVSNIFETLGVHSRAELMALIYDMGRR